MRHLMTMAAVLMAAGSVSAQDVPRKAPCALLGPASITQTGDHALMILFTCADGSLKTWTGASGGGAGAVTPDMHVYLDERLTPMDAAARHLGGTGWAFECGHTIARVVVMVGSEAFEMPRGFGGGYRLDVAQAYGASCASRAGLGFEVDLTALAPGTYPMQLHVYDDAGRYGQSNTITVSVGARGIGR